MSTQEMRAQVMARKEQSGPPIGGPRTLRRDGGVVGHLDGIDADLRRIEVTGSWDNGIRGGPRMPELTQKGRWLLRGHCKTIDVEH